MKRYVRFKVSGVLLDTNADHYMIYNDYDESDNLLDLVRVDDLVEFVDEQGKDYIFISKKYGVKEIELDFNIVAIWSRSGDTMKRYEVK